jgi:gamma-glutamyltranspeptidase / glutathione hydrolase
MMSSNAVIRLVEAAEASGPKVVTSAHPAATSAGIGAFAQGGNAFDAALAACFVETIALPMKCGLAGDVVALFRINGGPLRALISVGPGCAAIARGCKLELLGPKSVGIPGAPDGYATLAGFARFGLDRLIQPAVRAAHEGVAWTRIGLSYVHESTQLLARYNDATPYMPNGRVPAPGDILLVPGLGRLLERFARRGAALFAHEDGDRLIATLRAGGGFLEAGDLRMRPAKIVSPTIMNLGLDSLIVTPPPTGGSRLVEIMEQTVHGDRDLLEIVRAERVQARERGQQVGADGTSVVTAADDEGNAVVIVHSNSFPQFGSGVVLDDGLVLNNRPGRGFDLHSPPQGANAPRAGRVPETTLHAWALQQRDVLFMGATPGGVNQLPWNAQTLMQLTRGASIRQAVTSPRWALDAQDKLTVEQGADYCQAAPNGQAVPAFSQRSAQQVLRIPTTGLMQAAADPRVDALALAIY